LCNSAQQEAVSSTIGGHGNGTEKVTSLTARSVRQAAQMSRTTHDEGST